MKRAVLDGLRFGRLAVRFWRESAGAWLCECDCGGLKLASTNHLRRRQISSCGCAAPDASGDAVDRVMRRVTFDHGCWLFTGAKSAGGYGQVRMGSQTLYAHRIMYESEHGPAPNGFHVDHLCRTTACVNPSHLEAVTMRENMDRGSPRWARRARRSA